MLGLELNHAVLLSTVVCLFGARVEADSIQLRPPEQLLVGTVPLDPGDYAIPCVTDWNGDGRKDLIVGYRYADKVAIFLNSA